MISSIIHFYPQHQWVSGCCGVYEFSFIYVWVCYLCTYLHTHTHAHTRCVYVQFLQRCEAHPEICGGAEWHNAVYKITLQHFISNCGVLVYVCSRLVLNVCIFVCLCICLGIGEVSFQFIVYVQKGFVLAVSVTHIKKEEPEVSSNLTWSCSVKNTGTHWRTFSHLVFSSCTNTKEALWTQSPPLTQGVWNELHPDKSSPSWDTGKTTFPLSVWERG